MGGDFVNKLKNKNYLFDLAFLCDITGIFNELNLELQGKHKLITKLITIVEYFARKLKILITKMDSNNFQTFKNISIVLSQFKTLDKNIEYSTILKHLLTDYEMRFKDFNKIQNIIDLHENPLNCEIEKQDPELQTELEKMKQDFSIPLLSGVNFWKAVDEEKYPKIKDQIYKMYSMFGSTYNCESAFSTMKIILNKQRNRITDKHLADLLRIKTYEQEINMDSIISIQNND